MPATQKAVTEMSSADLEALDAVLEDFNLEADDGVVEEIEVPNVVLDDNELNDLDIAIERTEAYGAQAAASTSTEEEATALTSSTPKKARAAKAAGTATTRVPRDISSVPSEFFILTGDPATMDDAAKDAHKAATLALKPAQVKIAEKFENLLTSLSVGKEPSTYVMIAFKLLDAKKTVTSADIVGAYKASGLGEGTARSQSGQIMHLFDTVGIATRANQTLTLNNFSLIADRIRKLGASPSA